MKPGVIVNLSRTQSESGNNPLPNDWYKEEKWKRINDWVSEIEKETLKNNQELALLQTRRIKSFLESIQNKEKYKEQPMPSDFIADLEKLNRNWDRIVYKTSNDPSSTLEEENAILRKEIDQLNEMNRKILSFKPHH